MRVLVTQWPNPSHLYASIPMLWALQGAGHEVVVASHPDLAGATTRAGLTAVSLGTPDTVPGLTLENYGKYDLPQEHRDKFREPLGLTPEDYDVWEICSTYHQIGLHILHPPGGPSALADHLVDFALRWRPDLVIWEPEMAASPIAARLCGAAHARMVWGLDYSGWMEERFAARRAEVAAAGLTDPLLDAVEPIAAQYGVEVDDELLYGQWTIDPTPPAMRLPTRQRVVPHRRVPYTGIGTIPDWIYPKPQRPRVAVSLGASVREHAAGNDLIGTLLEMLGGLDVEVVATLNAAQLEGYTVPGNVRTVDFLPLNQLLPTCSALIHHGGGGTFTSAVAHQVPQLVVPNTGGVEAPFYARRITDSGAGIILDADNLDVDELRKQLMRVIEGPSFAEGARRLHADWLAMPSPNDVVPSIEKLTAQHR
ncbi:nucleotide disphospho-sugar-binding domain-containing protein [Lentzea nigeriaca]|uniref:nucleotide disphospho-sugar-binding domain-containing protein n=1 Tax=Lentzea nigeriaca TaxID=1128665 RepID=UPI0019563CF4|nr:nucleotide disphospho-sugar-binding domain-containing protein [Lentzea nigeriaca]MBM7862185.1 glycosyltransferase (activator-dependent family) [Lentzea nigeriaca]